MLISGDAREIFDSLLKCPDGEDIRYWIAALIGRSLDWVIWSRAAGSVWDGRI